MRLAGAQPPLGLGTIDRVKLLQRGQHAGYVVTVAGMNHVKVEGGDRSAVKHRADASHDDKINAMPGQDFQYFEKPGIRTLHGV